MHGSGAKLTIRSAGGPARVLGTIAPAQEDCSPYPAVTAPLVLDAGVTAVLSVQPRTGIFRPACYKDIINGFYELDTWDVLTLAFSGETMTLKQRDSLPFQSEPDCRSAYARMRQAR